MKDLCETAVELARSGLSVIPTDAKKIPVGKWADFQTRIATSSELSKMFAHAPAIAAIGGRVSGNLYQMDFEGKDHQKRPMESVYPQWAQLAKAELIRLGHSLLFARLVIVKTQNGGYHVRWRVEGDLDLKTEYLAKAWSGDFDDRGRAIPNLLIESRAEGSYALIPPSPGYEPIQGTHLDIPAIPIGIHGMLAELARSFHTAIEAEPAPPSVKHPQRQKQIGISPGDDYNLRGDRHALLTSNGWTYAGEDTKSEKWTRPGKNREDGHSAVWAKVDIQGRNRTLTAGHFRVFSTADPDLEEGESCDLFGLYARLEHDGNFGAATWALAKEGYGEQRSSKPPKAKSQNQADEKPNGEAPNGDVTSPPDLPATDASLIPGSTETAKTEGEKGFADILRSIGELAIMDGGFHRNEKIQGVIERLVDLSPVERAALIEKMKSVGLGTKATLESQLKAATQAQERRQTAVHQPQSSTLPNIVINTRQMREITADTLDAIQKANADNPSLFVRSGILTRIRIDEKGYTLAQSLTVDGARGMMGRVANFLKETSKEDGITSTAVSPPEVIAKDILSLPSYPQFLPLVSVVGFPILRKSGEFCTQTGYDPESRYYYHAAEEIHIGNTEPTEENVRDAKRLIIEELLGDFPFVDRASLANIVAEMLTPLVRPLIKGATPLFAHDAATPGTGKSLLASVCTLPFSVSGTSVMTAGRDDDEWRKRITAKLMTGALHVLIDNIKTKLSSGDLSAALTAKSDWEDRVLGQSQMIRLPVRCVWIATGNNLEFSDEIARRAVWIRMDAKVERPWKRTGFKHKDLEAWVEAHRSEILTALMVFVKKWFADGKPAGEEVMGSYSEWTRVVGGILKSVKVEGFLENAEELYEQVDTEHEAWVEFFGAWADKVGAYDEKSEMWGYFSDGQWITVDGSAVGIKDVFSLASHTDSKDDLEGLGLLDGLLGRGDEHARRINLGRILNKHKDRVFGPYRLERIREKVKHAIQYRLVVVKPMGESSGESSELNSPTQKTNDSAGSQPVLNTVGESGEFKSTLSRKIEGDRSPPPIYVDGAGIDSPDSPDPSPTGQESSGDKDLWVGESSIGELTPTHRAPEKSIKYPKLRCQKCVVYTPHTLTTDPNLEGWRVAVCERCGTKAYTRPNKEENA